MSLTPETRPTDFSWGHQDLERESCTQATPVGQLLIRHVQSSWETQILRKTGVSLAIQWLRLYTSNVEGKGSIPGWELRSHVAHVMAKTFFLTFLIMKDVVGWETRGRWVFAWRDQRKLQKGHEDSVGAGSQENKEGRKEEHSYPVNSIYRHRGQSGRRIW